MYAATPGRGFKITYETPKSDSLTLFNLGEKAYDHLVLFPIKSKGMNPSSPRPIGAARTHWPELTSRFPPQVSAPI